MSDPLILEIQNCTNPNYTVIVRPYAFGQYRIQLTDKRLEDSFAPAGHGRIVREMCTYNIITLQAVTKELAGAEEPELQAEKYARPYNCEHAHGRIRLDNERPNVMTE